MLTVKWVIDTPDGQIDRIFEAREVTVASRYDPTSPKAWKVAQRGVDRALVILDPSDPSFAGRSIDCGLVYVMNEAGATVGKYILSTEPVTGFEELAA